MTAALSGVSDLRFGISLRVRDRVIALKGSRSRAPHLCGGRRRRGALASERAEVGEYPSATAAVTVSSGRTLAADLQLPGSAKVSRFIARITRESFVAHGKPPSCTLGSRHGAGGGLL
jgi:hypothetical protein